MEPRTQSFSLALEKLPEADQERIAQLLDEYLVSIEQGCPIDPESLLRSNPNEAPLLKEYINGLNLFHSAAVKLSDPDENSPLSPKCLGDYKIIHEIARGGMGVVYEAEQSSLKRRVALKVLQFSVGTDEKYIQRFSNEAHAAASVEHPHIVPVYGIGEEQGTHYYAMQLIRGCSLASLLTQECSTTRKAIIEPVTPVDVPDAREFTLPVENGAKSRDRLPVGTLVTLNQWRSADTKSRILHLTTWGIQAGEALQAAHEVGVVHRDVKPSNLLIDEEEKLWITDFGLARCRDVGDLTKTGDILGTTRYMSPEQAGGEVTDHRTDIYSLGVTLYELATGHHPAGNPSNVELLLKRDQLQQRQLRYWNQQIPVDFQTIIMKAIAESPSDRYASAGDMAEDLHRFQEGLPILASPPSLLRRSLNWARRHHRIAGMFALLLVAVVVVQSVNNVRLAYSNSEKDTALRQKEQALLIAEENLGQAMDVLDLFSSRTVDQLAAIPGAEGVRYQLLQDSLGYYEQFEVQAREQSAMQAQLAHAYRKMGHLSERMGDVEKSLSLHNEAKVSWQLQLDNDPANSEAAGNLAICNNNIGLLLLDMQKPQDALQLFLEAEELQRTILKTDQKHRLEIHNELAATLNNIGLTYQELGDSAEAIYRFKEAIKIYRLSEKDPLANELYMRGLAASYGNLGSVLNSIDSKAAGTAYHKAIRLQRKLVQSQPVNRLYQGDLARTYSNLGYLLAECNDWEGAEESYSNAVKIQRHLVDASPLAMSYRRDLAISYNNLGMTQFRANLYDEAQSTFAKGLNEQKVILAANPNDARTMSNLGSIFNNIGLLHVRNKNHLAAEYAFKQAIDYQQGALNVNPNFTQYQSLLSNHFLNYSDCLRSQNKTKAAEIVDRQRNNLVATK